jgi:hypothetical protein
MAWAFLGSELLIFERLVWRWLAVRSLKKLFCQSSMLCAETIEEILNKAKSGKVIFFIIALFYLKDFYLIPSLIPDVKIHFTLAPGSSF